VATPLGHHSQQSRGNTLVSNSTGTQSPTAQVSLLVTAPFVPAPAPQVVFPVLAFHPPDDEPGALVASRKFLVATWTNRRRCRAGVSSWLGPITGLPTTSGVGFGSGGFGQVPFGGFGSLIQLALKPWGVNPSAGDWAQPFYVAGQPGYLFATPTIGAYRLWANVPAGPLQFATIDVV
jgi:hypothetical protein